jgi:tetracycline repressor-like protein
MPGSSTAATSGPSAPKPFMPNPRAEFALVRSRSHALPNNIQIATRLRPTVSAELRKLPTQERSRATVEAFLTATARILASEGYEKASTNCVAEVAGYGIGSLYEYFPNKESLVATAECPTLGTASATARMAGSSSA